MVVCLLAPEWYGLYRSYHISSSASQILVLILYTNLIHIYLHKNHILFCIWKFTKFEVKKSSEPSKHYDLTGLHEIRLVNSKS